VVIASVQTRTDLVAPPLKGERTNRHHVPVEHPRARQQPVHAQRAQTPHDLGERLVVGEVLEPNRAQRRTTLDEPRVRRLARDLYLVGQGFVHDDLVLELLGLFGAGLEHESR